MGSNVPVSHTTTDRGFWIPADGNDKAFTDEVTALYMNICDPDFNQQCWEFKRRALALATRVLTQHRSVLYHPFTIKVEIGRYVDDFLIDTWRYLATGSQYMHPMHWRDLMDLTVTSGREIHMAGPKDRENYARYSKDLGSISALLSAWVSHSNGFEHLIQSLYVIYGRRAAN